MGGIFRTIKTVKTVTLELKSKAKKSQDFYTQIVRTIGLNSRFNFHPDQIEIEIGGDVGER